MVFTKRQCYDHFQAHVLCGRVCDCWTYVCASVILCLIQLITINDNITGKMDAVHMMREFRFVLSESRPFCYVFVIPMSFHFFTSPIIIGNVSIHRKGEGKNRNNNNTHCTLHCFETYYFLFIWTVSLSLSLSLFFFRVCVLFCTISCLRGEFRFYCAISFENIVGDLSHSTLSFKLRAAWLLHSPILPQNS